MAKDAKGAAAGAPDPLRGALLRGALRHVAHTIAPLPPGVSKADAAKVIAQLVADGLAHPGRSPNLTASGLEAARSL